MPASVTTESSLSQDTSALFEINSVEQVVEEESLRLSPEENNNNSTQTALITRATLEDGSQAPQEQFKTVKNVISETITFHNINTTTPFPPSDLDSSVQEDKTTLKYKPDNAPEPHERSSAPSFSEPTTVDLLGLDDIVQIGNSLLPPLSTMNKLDITHISLLDCNQEPSGIKHDTSITPGIQPRRPASAAAEVFDFPPLDSDIEIFPSPTTLKGCEAIHAAVTEIGTETHIEPIEYEDKVMTETPVVHNQFNSWSRASERVVMGAIQCLTETKDMELSYVSLLSAITVLNSRYTDCDDHGRVYGSKSTVKAPENMRAVAAAAIGAEDPVGKLYAQLLSILTRPSVVNDLEKEIVRQGVISSDALYFRLYNSILNAGYHLQDEDHVHLGQFLFDRQNTKDALDCLDKIDPTRWTGHIYRLAISCHLFTKPRHLHEAEILFDQYLTHNKSLSSSSSFFSSSTSSSATNQGKSMRGSRTPKDMDREQFNKSLIQSWFKQQLDASKWNEIKAQYERRRARLLDAPSNIERFSASLLQLDSVSGGLSEHKKERSSVSRASFVADHGSVTPGSTESLAAAARTAGITQAPTPVAPEPAPPVAAQPKLSSFSLLSMFRSSKPTSIAPPVPTIQTRDICRPSPFPSASTRTVQVNRHLTILDNGMLEECVNHKQFEYGWSIYEGMGPLLEDKDTAKIAMRLCKRAFLGHGGLGPNSPGSPSVLAKDIYIEDETVQSAAIDDLSACTGAGGVGPDRSKAVQEDPEIWEARAWVIYNKAMVNPYFLNLTVSPSNSPTQTQSPSVVPSATSSASATIGTSRGSGTLTSPISSMAGTTALSVFLHNTLTIAINSQERSSRYLKAFRIYSTMRNDPLGQYQSQLRDPFVMTCMIKAIYETVLILVRAQDQQRHRQQQQQQQSFSSSATSQQRRASVSSLAPNQQQQSQQMTIGPLIDLAFEIYADMRNVGPIRHLPRLSALAPSTPTPRTPQTAQDVTASSNMGSSMSIFFQLASRTPASSSTAVDLSACGVTAPSNEVSAVNSANTLTTSATTESANGSYLTSTTSSSSSHALPCVLQDLNSTLRPTILARRLPTELYLALLHLCIQVPLSGVSASSQVVKTIVADMVSTKPGQQPANLDRHLAAALQVYHDRWMCRTVELKGRRRCQSSSGRRAHVDESDGGEEEFEEVVLEAKEIEQNDDDSEEEVEEGGCIFHGWMYRPEEYVLKHMASSPSDFTTNNNTSTDADEILSPSTEEKDSPFEVSKYDADLDELDRYLDEKKVGLADEDNNNSSGGIGQNTSEGAAGANSWMEGLDHDTCNGRFYWDMWNREDPVLQEIRFSRRRARMLWRHVAEL
ncbi:hypothetical protein BGZ89_001729 [Linnemannia elongata]|nr:hypothetical protein BGZ89_001729 [Linnemannia elongata]